MISNDNRKKACKGKIRKEKHAAENVCIAYEQLRREANVCVRKKGRE